MYKVIYSAIVLIFFSLSANSQTMRKEDIADAIITAVEYNNEFDNHFTTNIPRIPLYTVFVNKDKIWNDTELDRLIKELNNIQNEVTFYSDTKEGYRKCVKEIKKKKFESLRVWFSEVDSNRIMILINPLQYNRHKKYCWEISDGSYVLCCKSKYSNKWFVIHEFFIHAMYKNNIDYEVLTKQLYDNLQHKQLETENDYILLFNYLRKQDDSEYYAKIKELLCSIIEKNPEITERVDNYFFLFSELRTIDENTSVIEENYKKITEKTH